MSEQKEVVKLWKITEAAAFLNISSGTLYHWVSQKRVPCVRFGSRCLRFNPEHTKQWAATHLHPAVPQNTDNHTHHSANEKRK